MKRLIRLRSSTEHNVRSSVAVGDRITEFLTYECVRVDMKLDAVKC